MLIYRIADPGQGFDIERLRHAAISNPDDDPLRHAIVREDAGMRPGGLGLAMTTSLVDELIYNEARNEVMFVKYLD
jgi:anti-sigma regulatory factor (Ser/Thr protein kinase)